jgi:hypothetical protein
MIFVSNLSELCSQQTSGRHFLPIFQLQYVAGSRFYILYLPEYKTLTKRDRKQLNIFERKVYRKILGPVYDNEKENWRMLTKKEIYARVKKPTITETIRLNRLR